MRNIKLQQIFSQPSAFSSFEVDDNYFIASRDGKSLIAITFETINDKTEENTSKSIHVCKYEIDNNDTTCKKVDKRTSLLDILEDVEEDELTSVHNTPAIGVVHVNEDDESDNFEEILDIGSVQNIVIGTKAGHLIKIRVCASSEHNFADQSSQDSKYNASIIGSFDDGLSAICKSPDEELVVAVSSGVQGNGKQVIIMSSEFDLLLETPLDPDVDGTEESVNVGWGAKETQFHGKAGKQAAKAKTKLESSGYLDDEHVKIVWREDCQFFAISHLSKRLSDDGISQLRRIRIFDREGTLLHTSEPIGGLESGRPFTWKPSGSLMAGTVRKPNGKYVVSFFEKNGLMHGEFEIKKPSKSVNSKIIATHLEWNKDSTVLMVVSKDVFDMENEKDNQNPVKHYVQLWSASNYRWQLKQCMTFESPIIYHEWASVLPDGSQHPIVLNIVTADGSFQSYRYSWRVDCSGETLIEGSHVTCDRDLANVAIIDGCTLKVTPFTQTVVPPPISAYELHFKNEVRQVIFPTSSERHRNKMIVITTNDDVFLCGLENVVSSKDNDGLSNSVTVTGCGGQGFGIKCDILKPDTVFHKSQEENHKLKNLNMNDLSNFVYITGNTDENNAWIIASRYNQLLVFELSDNCAQYSLKSVHTCESPIFNISSIITYDELSNNEQDEAIIQLNNGAVLAYLPEHDTVKPWQIGNKELHMVAKCTKLSALHRPIKELTDNKTKPTIKLLALSEKNRLYLDGVEIATGVTSYFLHTHFLLITTLQHTLRSLPISTFFNVEITNEIKSELWINESTRALERGSRLVVAVPPPDTKVVLQMPRGNLEVIHPRVLALQIIKGLLNDCKFTAAMEIFRRQRINQNLIVDHDPDHFFSNVQDFVNQVSIQGTQRLCLFVADLMEEDCTKTMFQSMYSEKENKEANSLFWSLNKKGKVWEVCSSLLSVLETDIEKYILPIISCLVKRTSLTTKSIMDEKADGIEDALTRIQSMRSVNPQLAEEALSFLSLLVVGEGGGGDRLFDAALGVYDFDLVLFVAEKSSQKDPKEYLPFLNDLRMLPQGEAYRNYRIDMYLKRYRLALKHLAKYISDNPSNENNEVSTTEEVELLNLVREQRLYSEALKIFKLSSGSSDHIRHVHSKISIAYADYLFSKKYYEDSALMYESGNDRTNAIKAWEQAGNWAYCLALATSEKMPSSEFELICRRLIEKLKGNKYKSRIIFYH